MCRADTSCLIVQHRRGEALDGRSDLYSVGILFYEMLVKHRPFTAATPIALVHQHIYDAPPRLGAGLARYQELLDVLLAKRPDDRFASAACLLEYLAQLEG